MTLTRKTALAAAIALSVVGCERATLGTSESVVGASALPPTSELDGETIQINRDSGYGKDHHYLSYELRPNDRLRITHSLDSFDGKDVVGKEAFQLSRELALRVRKTLWHMRPAKLQGVEYLKYPVDCEPPIDNGVEVAVAFFGQHDRIGIFALPYACKDGQAAIARAAMKGVMESLPHSKVAQAFPESG